MLLSLLFIESHSFLLKAIPPAKEMQDSAENVRDLFYAS